MNGMDCWFKKTLLKHYWFFMAERKEDHVKWRINKNPLGRQINNVWQSPTSILVLIKP